MMWPKENRLASTSYVAHVLFGRKICASFDPNLSYLVYFAFNDSYYRTKYGGTLHHHTLDNVTTILLTIENWTTNNWVPA